MDKRRGELIKGNFNAVGSNDWKNNVQPLALGSNFFVQESLVFDDKAGIGWTEQRTG